MLAWGEKGPWATQCMLRLSSARNWPQEHAQKNMDPGQAEARSGARFAICISTMGTLTLTLEIPGHPGGEGGKLMTQQLQWLSLINMY